MLSWIREKFGTAVISVIIGLIAAVFVFYGVFSPKATRGVHEAAVAGIVNGDPITHKEFRDELNRRLDFFRQMGGGQFSEEQLKAFRIKEGVFQELVKKKLLVQESERNGMTPSNEEVKEKIQQMPVFQKDGRFDLTTYKQILEANGYTPGGFERRMREDITTQQWDIYFRNRVKVSEEEIKKQFLINGDKRQIKYVVLNTDTGRKGLTIADAEIEKFLKDPSKESLAKNRYERMKDVVYKGKAYDAVKKEIAKDMIGSEKVDEVQKVNQKLADQILPLMTVEKASDAKVNAILKPYGGEVRSSTYFSRMETTIVGIGETSDIIQDAFADQLGKVKKYTRPNSIVLAVVTGAEKPDMAKLESQREGLIRQIAGRKARDLYDGWIKMLNDKAKIEQNPEIVGYQEEGGSG